MFIKKQKPEKSGLENAIEQVLLEMQGFTADEDEYSKMVDQLTKLYALKEIDKKEHVSKDTLAIVFGHILGILIVVHYEKANVVTSKALNLLFKLR